MLLTSVLALLGTVFGLLVLTKTNYRLVFTTAETTYTPTDAPIPITVELRNWKRRPWSIPVSNKLLIECPDGAISVASGSPAGSGGSAGSVEFPGGSTSTSFSYTPSSPGLHRIRVRLERRLGPFGLRLFTCIKSTTLHIL